MAITRNQLKPTKEQEVQAAASSSDTSKNTSYSTTEIPSPGWETVLDDDSYVVKVEDTFFDVPRTFFSHVESKRHAALSGYGMTLQNPIVLSGHTVDQFKKVLWAFASYPFLDLRQLNLNELLTIAELSREFYLNDLMTWCINSITLVVNSPATPLRTASSQVFFRMLKLAILYRKTDLFTSIQIKWMSRLHWHEVSPIPAILLADAYGLRRLLSHAYYVYLVLMEPRISKSLRIDIDSSLSPKQNMHVYCGYYSLMAYWKHLCRTPPEFMRAKDCDNHLQCLKTWKMRWSVVCTRPYSLSEIDVLTRLRSVEKCLAEDIVLGVTMSVQCRTQALASVSKKREEIANNLHHHFDLDL